MEYMYTVITGIYTVTIVAIDNSSGQCRDTAYGDITIVPSPTARIYC